MKDPTMVLLILVLLVSPALSKDIFDFRSKTLERFNAARRLLASGDLGKIGALLPDNYVPKDKFDFDLLGPARDMEKLRWDRKLEQVGFEYVNDKNVVRASNPLKTIEYKDYKGFMFFGEVTEMVNQFMKFLPLDIIKGALHEFLETLEAFIFAVLMGLAAPKTTPIPKDASFGIAETLFAHRHRVGCWSEMAYSYCFVHKIDYRPKLFEQGVACTNCTAHCEFWEQEDGTIEEGELCIHVEPKGENGAATGRLSVLFVLLALLRI